MPNNIQANQADNLVNSNKDELLVQASSSSEQDQIKQPASKSQDSVDNSSFSLDQNSIVDQNIEKIAKLYNISPTEFDMDLINSLPQEESIDQSPLEQVIDEIKELIQQKVYPKAKEQIKQSLQECNSLLNKNQHLSEEAELFRLLGDCYADQADEAIMDYPKAAALYQYADLLLKKLKKEQTETSNAEPTDSKLITEQEAVNKKISDIEEQFLSVAKVKLIETKLKPIDNNGNKSVDYKDALIKFRLEISAELKEIDNLGIIKTNNSQSVSAGSSINIINLANNLQQEEQLNTNQLSNQQLNLASEDHLSKSSSNQATTLHADGTNSKINPADNNSPLEQQDNNSADDSALDKQDLKERSSKVEEIYQNISNFFVNDNASNLGLINQLLNNSIKQLGGIPQITDPAANLKASTVDEPKEFGINKDNHNSNANLRPVRYCIYGMGSIAVGAFTPYSDFEGGILIEEDLNEDDSQKVKEYFRLLTTLLHIKVIALGETILPSLAIKELNDFTSSDKENEWFYDDLTPRGFCFDGAMPSACKTPLGREGYEQVIQQAGQSIIKHPNFSLISTPSELLKFQVKSSDDSNDNDHNISGTYNGRYDKNAINAQAEQISDKSALNKQPTDWYAEDPQLVQALWHTSPIMGDLELLENYQAELNKDEYSQTIKERSFDILKKDLKAFDPWEQLKDISKAGRLMNVKKEIYRFVDRTIVALGDCLSQINKTPIESIDDLKKKGKLSQEGASNLKIALSIAKELRLRTYLANGSQRDDLSVLSKFESNIKELQIDQLTKQVFHLDNLDLLYHYYYTTIALSTELNKYLDLKSLDKQSIIDLVLDQSPIVKGLIHCKCVKYYNAIEEFEKIIQEHSINFEDKFVINLQLGMLYSQVSEYEKAHERYDYLLRYSISNLQKAQLLSNKGALFDCQGQYKQALKYHRDSLKIYQSAHSNLNIIRLIDNIAVTQINLGNNEIAIKLHKKSLSMKKEGINDKYQITLSFEFLGQAYIDFDDKKALRYLRKSLNIKKKLFKGDHIKICLLLNGMGNAFNKLSDHHNASLYFEEGLLMAKRIFKNNTDVAKLLQGLGASLMNSGNYQQGLEYNIEALKLCKNIYGKNPHSGTARALHNLSMSMEIMHDYKEATNYAKQALEIRRQLFNKFEMLESISHLASLYDLLKHHKEAFKLHQEVLEIIDKISSGTNKMENGMVIGIAFSNLSNHYRTLSYNKTSLEYNLKSLQIYKNMYQTTSHDLLFDSLRDVGTSYGLLNEHQVAIDYFLEGINVYQKIPKTSKNNINFTLLLEQTARVYSLLNQLPAAINYLQQALKFCESIPNSKEYKFRTVDLLNALGATLSNMGEYEQALTYLVKGIEICNVVANPIYSILLDNLTITLGKKNISDDIFLYQAIQHLKLNKVGDQKYNVDPKIADSMHNIGIRLSNLGKYNEALSYFDKNLEVVTQSESDKAFVLNNKGITLCKLGEFEDGLRNIEKALIIKKYLHQEVDHLQTASSLYCMRLPLYGLQRYQEALDYEIQSDEMKIRLEYQINHNNLACAYFSKAVYLKQDNQSQEQIDQFLTQADKVFNQGLLDKPRAGLYIKYANFLIYQNKFEGALSNLEKTILDQDLQNKLGYDQIESMTVDQNIQKIINNNDQITVDAHLMAYYLLIKNHEQFEISEQQKQQYLKEFNEQVVATNQSIANEIDTLNGSISKKTQDKQLSKINESQLTINGQQTASLVESANNQHQNSNELSQLGDEQQQEEQTNNQIRNLEKIQALNYTLLGYAYLAMQQKQYAKKSFDQAIEHGYLYLKEEPEYLELLDTDQLLATSASSLVTDTTKTASWVAKEEAKRQLNSPQKQI